MANQDVSSNIAQQFAGWRRAQLCVSTSNALYWPGHAAP